MSANSIVASKNNKILQESLEGCKVSVLPKKGNTSISTMDLKSIDMTLWSKIGKCKTNFYDVWKEIRFNSVRSYRKVLNRLLRYLERDSI